MYLQKEVFEDIQSHKFIYTIHDYKENTSNVMKESEIKGYIVFIVCFENFNYHFVLLFSVAPCAKACKQAKIMYQR